MPNRIKSIAAGGEWWLGYEVDDPNGYFERVVFFALSEDPEDSDVDMVVGQSHSFVEDGIDVNTPRNFRGYFHSNEFLKVGQKLTEDAMTRFVSGV